MFKFKNGVRYEVQNNAAKMQFLMGKWVKVPFNSIKNTKCSKYTNGNDLGSYKRNISSPNGFLSCLDSKWCPVSGPKLQPKCSFSWANG